MGVDGIKQQIVAIGQTLGFADVRVSKSDPGEATDRLMAWLEKGYHGEMAFMSRYRHIRADPTQLVKNAVRVISVRLDYLPEDLETTQERLLEPDIGFISRYALGRDYHKLIRQRLKVLAQHVEALIGPFGYRVFSDSAPILEKPLAAQGGLGWMGKHTNLIQRHAGSYFFIGEILTDLPLPVDDPVQNHCGSCTACIDVCPTAAIIAPYVLDARRCISYLTIEHPGSIPMVFRKAFGHRIYGCDDCQIVCPWNRYASLTKEKDFLPRHGLDARKLHDLFAFSESEFLALMEGSAIRRIGHERWLRNIAVALGNAPTSPKVMTALKSRLDDPSPLVREHVAWALDQHLTR
ncbi:MAG: tRNA epoxyqueuosine(34) reductase QueG [Methylococcus sp.]|nr:MAG: tRNA epoxyqueuosine(34) reductase QueG [Methylococcus sp.]